MQLPKGTRVDHRIDALLVAENREQLAAGDGPLARKRDRALDCGRGWGLDAACPRDRLRVADRRREERVVASGDEVKRRPHQGCLQDVIAPERPLEPASTKAFET